jgi:hypothetical protein
MFDAFTEDDDPWGEHDFGAFDHEGGVIVESVPNPTLRRGGQKSLQIGDSLTLISLGFSEPSPHGRKL